MEDRKWKSVQMVVVITAMLLSFVVTVAGQGKIDGHLGVRLGMNIAELRAVLKKNPCISKTKAGEPWLERVPLKPYYRTSCRHSSRLNSEITFWIDVDKGIEQIRESFGGEAIDTLADTRREFARLKVELSKIWGSPKQDAKDIAIWKDGNRAAILRVIPPDHPESLPILKVVVSVHGLASQEMQKTLAGRVF